MRVTIPRLLIAGLLAAGLATGADGQTKPAAKKPVATARKAPPPPAPEPPPPPPNPANQVKTSDQMKRESVQGAVTAPLRDFNVVKTEIPEALTKAVADPYARPPGKWTCKQLIALLMPLEEALGPDIDKLPTEDPSMTERGKSTALGLGAELASGAIPFRGVVRRVSGAATHDRMVQDAILAGSVRRAYLKGLGETKGCGPPATPSHERAGLAAAPVVEERSPFKPKYPTSQPAAPQTTSGKPQAAPRK